MSFDSDGGRIGPFWWLNGCMSAIEIHGATYNGSRHLCWREGVSGWGSPVGKKYYWRIIK